MREIRFTNTICCVAVMLLSFAPQHAASAPEEAEVRLTNEYGETLEVFILLEDGTPESIGVLRHGAHMDLSSQMKDVWILRTTTDSPVEVHRFVVKQPKQIVTVRKSGPGAAPPDPKPPDPAPARPDPDSAAPEKPQQQSATLVVVNGYDEAVALKRAATGSGPSVRRLIGAGKTLRQETTLGATWTIVKLRGNVLLRRVTVKSATQTEKLDPPQVPPPKPPSKPAKPPSKPSVPRPQTKSLTVTVPVSAIGIWHHVSGDTEMDTDGRDRVPVEAKSLLHYSESGVRVNVWFSCREMGGDRTAFRGPRHTFDVATVDNGKIERGWRVVGITPRGRTGATFTATTTGRQHGFTSFDTRGTFWDRLAFRVDGPGRSDHRVVGLRGQITVDIKLEK